MMDNCKAGPPVRLAVLLVAGAVCAAAQSQAPPQGIPAQPDQGKRLSLGVVAGGSLTSGVNSVSTSVNTSSTDPPTVTASNVDSKTSRYIIGGAVRYDIGERFGLGMDLIYKRGGYDTSISLSEQVTDDEDGDLLHSSTETTRAHLWDAPVLGRYYFKPRSDDGTRGFITGGLALRYATGLTSASETTDEDLITDTDIMPIGPANDVIGGVVLGAGLRARDDVGVKIDIEFRLTRWLNPTFQSGPASSNRNQADIMVGITF